MGYGAESSIVGIVAAVIGIVLILTVVLRMWKKVPQDKAGVVTGMKAKYLSYFSWRYCFLFNKKSI